MKIFPKGVKTGIRIPINNRLVYCSVIGYGVLAFLCGAISVAVYVWYLI